MYVTVIGECRFSSADEHHRLAINPVVWQDYNTLYGISFAQLNYTYAAQCIGMAFGCVFFIPFALKYGRKPVYIASTFVVFLTAVWQACLRDLPNMIAANLVSGLFGAVGDTLVQMTVADIFFLHQRGTMNAIYVFVINIGSLLAPVAAGYSAHSQGWPWIFWWCAVLLGINLLLFVFCYEETKYMVIDGIEPRGSPPRREGTDDNMLSSKSPEEFTTAVPLQQTQTQAGRPDRSLKTYWQRITHVSVTPGGFKTFVRHAYQPFFILATFPATAYTALQYGSLLSWYSVIAVTQTEYFSVAPYNFSTVGIGLLSLPPFIGCLVGAFYSGPLSDWSIQWLARRNNNIYEPEMRLYIAILPILLGPAGLFLYGYSLAKGAPWIVPCLGYGIYGFAQASMFGLSLTYLVDCYEEIVGDALVGVAFIRNGLAAGITFATSPWVTNLGLWNSFTSVGCLCLGFGLLTVPMVIWGKRLRELTSRRYAIYADLQSNPRGQS
ncbi:hypothetical protein A1O3_04607 [Capronia epimyces CBS 606.96]|uniref:Major facilitator superfamily (MFS) profile domain-containing protein n=1 Tax=Capronia epimyces CBS 606.96 TaxID=1182542 RepID=W9Y2U3_9EURO|nr:uncharacterized protein A1O3_04607 [Capronia epimyces CBS 606.96]EXJ83940.1 hypothetical protein A1O3_04607 [Capronia epimyces CBS 606.96]